MLILVSGVKLNRLEGGEHVHVHDQDQDQDHDHDHDHDNQAPREGRTESGYSEIENQVFSK